MVKQTIFYLALSIIVVVFAHYFAVGILQVDHLHTWLNLKASTVFSHSIIGLTVQQVIVLMALPLVIAGVPALTYKLVKGGSMPYFLNVVWLVWLIVVLSKIAIQ